MFGVLGASSINRVLCVGQLCVHQFNKKSSSRFCVLETRLCGLVKQQEGVFENSGSRFFETSRSRFCEPEF